MRDAKVNADAFTGYDAVTGDPKIDWTKLDETKVIVGYAFAWRLTNGFEKIVYWTRDAVEAHAKRFSQAYKAKKQDSPWITDFDSMALKTVIKSALAKWAPLSLEMQQAIVRDESAQKDPDSEPIYADGVPLSGEVEEIKKPIFTPPGGAPVEEKKDTKPAQEEKHPDLEPQKEPPAKPDPATAKQREALIDTMKTDMLDHNVTEARLWKYALEGKHVPEGVDELWNLPTETLNKLWLAIRSLGKKTT